jgi:hypothetical protein
MGASGETFLERKRGKFAKEGRFVRILRHDPSRSPGMSEPELALPWNRVTSPRIPGNASLGSLIPGLLGFEESPRFSLTSPRPPIISTLLERKRSGCGKTGSVLTRPASDLISLFAPHDGLWRFSRPVRPIILDLDVDAPSIRPWAPGRSRAIGPGRFRLR